VSLKLHLLYLFSLFLFPIILPRHSPPYDMVASCPEQLVFVTDLQLQAIIRLGVSLPSFDTGERNGVLFGSQVGI
jgi:hypothetical protein